MRLRPDQLQTHLEGGLLPIYVLSGEEPLQREECLDALRAAARAQGYEERVVHHADRRFDWIELSHFADSLSLFASRRILEVRVEQKLDDAGRKALVSYAERPPPDVVLFLVFAFRVDATMGRSKWFQSLESVGAHLPLWPVQAAAMIDWVQDRARGQGLDLSAAAASLLAERGEGNLLAAAQEIEKLRLLHSGQQVDVEQVIAATSDSARFNAFDLVDACFTGDAPRAVRVLRGLREEGMRVAEVLGPLAWAMRIAAEVAEITANGTPLERALGPRHGAWKAPARRRVLQSALSRHSAQRWARLLSRASVVDRRGKGDQGRLNLGIRRAQGDAWNELENLGLALCGVSARGRSAYTEARTR